METVRVIVHSGFLNPKVALLEYLMHAPFHSDFDDTIHADILEKYKSRPEPLESVRSSGTGSDENRDRPPATCILYLYHFCDVRTDTWRNRFRNMLETGGVLSFVTVQGYLLLRAAFRGDIEMIKSLCDQVLDRTFLAEAFLYAALSREQRAMDLLLRVPGTWNARNLKGDTTLRIAADLALRSAVQTLLRTGNADVNAKGTGGMTPLSRALLNMRPVL